MPESAAEAFSAKPIRRPSKQHSSSRSATRALDVLEYFGQTRRSARAIEIARALDMHPSTTNQLLKTLVDSAHLIFDARSKTYLPSPRLTAFGVWIVANYGTEDRLHKLLQDIHRSTGAVATLTACNDLFMQVIDIVGSMEWEQRVQRGLHVSLFESPAVGNAYLSVLPDKEVARLSERARLPKRGLPILLQKISRIRHEGISEGLSADGAMFSMAIPLPETSPTPLVVAIADRAELIQNHRSALHAKMLGAISRWVATH